VASISAMGLPARIHFEHNCCAGYPYANTNPLRRAKEDEDENSARWAVRLGRPACR